MTFFFLFWTTHALIQFNYLIWSHIPLILVFSDARWYHDQIVSADNCLKNASVSERWLDLTDISEIWSIYCITEEQNL